MKGDMLFLGVQLTVVTLAMYVFGEASLFFRITTALVAAKAIVIGSDLNFDLLRKHGQRYWEWYCKREKFD